jgi:hypothetical protein
MKPTSCDMPMCSGWSAPRLDAGLTETHLRGVGVLTARLQQHGQTMPVRDGFDRRRVDDVTELGRGRVESLSPEVISAARDLVNDLDPGGGAVVAEVLERARRPQNVLGSGPDVYGLNMLTFAKGTASSMATRFASLTSTTAVGDPLPLGSAVVSRAGRSH